ncbi:hypothetical protein [Levilactobacillus enshiensis]|uniref:hypothetical protein n=1 Tax=Levilactobacillus enshiensis TaxID=2590213 RepID=UPI00117B1621|nr:hypothetical protein [Levilactobacillus enshiensis]
MAGVGWFAIHRKILKSEVYLHPGKLKLWITLLSMTSYKKSSFPFNGIMVNLHSGQLVTGRNKLAEIYNWGSPPKDQVTPKTIWSWVKRFEDMGMVSVKSKTRYSIITITNWEEYQSKPKEKSDWQREPEDEERQGENEGAGNWNDFDEPPF